MTSCAGYQKTSQGFALLPLLFLLLISQILILQGSKQLHASLAMHQLKLYQDCQSAAKKVGSSLAKSSCPKCPLTEGCDD